MHLLYFFVLCFWTNQRLPEPAHGWMVDFFSLAKRVFVQNHFYENACYLYIHYLENQVIFMWNVLHKHSFEREARQKATPKWKLRVHMSQVAHQVLKKDYLDSYYSKNISLSIIIYHHNYHQLFIDALTLSERGEGQIPF